MLSLIILCKSSGLSQASPLYQADLTHFQGTVLYDPGTASPRPQVGVPVKLLGLLRAGDAVTLNNTTTGADGSFELETGAVGSFDSFAIVKEDPRGFVPDRASASDAGFVTDPNMVIFPGTSSGVICCVEFVVADPFLIIPNNGERYLIVTSQAVVPDLTDFIAYKQFLGFNVVVKTVETLDPTGTGGNHLRNQIRNYEKSLFNSPGGLKYVLLIGTDAVVPFLKLNPRGLDWWPQPVADWPKHCQSYAHGPNNCGWASDWYYVDLTSDWNSNNDQVIGEGFWAYKPEEVKDAPPAFHTDVFLGRLPFDNPSTVQHVLETIMAFEKDGGAWKRNVLLAGAMMDYGGRGWNKKKKKYQNLAGPTDSGYLMEQVWHDILKPEGYTRTRLYEKAHPPTGSPPSGFPVDAPLSRTELINQWTGQDYGLVKAAGHGNNSAVVRTVWAHDYLTEDGKPNGMVDNPTEPLSTGDGTFESKKELEDSIYFLDRSDVLSLQTPAGKAPILTVMACATGYWPDAGNSLPGTLLAGGRISAWIGGTANIPYRSKWQVPADGAGQTIDYNITEALFRQGLPLGEAVWTGLAQYYADFGANWGGSGSWDWGFVNWDLYGDPSMSYWGNGPDLQAPWPMFHYNWPGKGETALKGPENFVGWKWSGPMAPTPLNGRTASPVVGRDGQVVVGDGHGRVHAFTGTGQKLWSYQTGGAIVNAAALSLDGTVYVKSTDGKLYAINADGSLRWSRDAGRSEASPKIADDGTIYVGGSNNNNESYSLRAYRPDGTLAAWRLVDGRITTTPSFDINGDIWFGTAAGTLYNMSHDLSTASGYSLSPGFALGDGLALSGDKAGIVLAPSLDGRLIAWSIADKKILWAFTTGGSLYSAPALGQNGQLFFGSRDGKVYAVKLSDGSKLWEFDTGGPVDSSPALDAINVYVVGGGDPAQLYILRRSNGTLNSLNEQLDPAPLTVSGTSLGGSSPAIGSSHMLYTVSSQGRLDAWGQDYWLMPSLITEAEPHFWDDILIQWQVGDPAGRTQVERRFRGDVWRVIATLEPGITEFADYDIIPGQRYQYRIITLPGVGQDLEPSDYSAPVEVRVPAATPDTPTAPSMTPFSSTEMRLTWPRVDPRTVSIRILRQGPNQSEFVPIVEVPGGATKFVDSELEPNSSYIYQLQAIGEVDDSAPSDIGRESTWPRTLPAPSQIVVEPLDGITFEVCWNPGEKTLSTIVARLPDGLARPELLREIEPGQTCFVDDNAYDYTFEYWVKHTNGENESLWTRSVRTSFATAPDDHHIFLPIIIRE